MKKLLLPLLITIVSLNVLAQSEEVQVHPLDANNDGLISVEEAKIDGTLSAIFNELDINQDGYLSSLELEVKTADSTN